MLFVVRVLKRSFCLITRKCFLADIPCFRWSELSSKYFVYDNGLHTTIKVTTSSITLILIVVSTSSRLIIELVELVVMTTSIIFLEQLVQLLVIITSCMVMEPVVNTKVGYG